MNTELYWLVFQTALLVGFGLVLGFSGFVMLLDRMGERVLRKLDGFFVLFLGIVLISFGIALGVTTGDAFG